MGNRIEIELAVDSPLYAPLYLAKRLSGTQGGLRRSFNIFHRVDFRYRGAPKRNGVDPLVENVLRGSRYSRDDDACLMAVGDPMRMISALMDGSGRRCDTPYVVGGIVQQMCFWLIDVSVIKPEAKPSDHFSRIYVHRRGMTGYSVLAYELQKIDNLAPGQLNGVLRECRPGNEGIWYRAARWPSAIDNQTKQLNGEQARGLAYLAADPFIGMRAAHPKTAKRSHQTVREYHDKATRKDDFSNALMTGAIVSKDVYEGNSSRRIEIDDLVGCVEDAVGLIVRDPHLAAHFLSDYEDQRISFRRYPLSEQLLGGLLEKLVSDEVYNRHSSMRCHPDSVAKAIAIRGLSIKEESALLDTIKDKPEEFFALSDNDEASRQEDYVELSTLWKSLLDEERSQVASLAKTRAWVQGLSLGLAATFGVLLLKESAGRNGWLESLIQVGTFLGFSIALVPAARDLCEVYGRMQGGRHARKVGTVAGLTSVFVTTILILCALKVVSDVVRLWVERLDLLNEPGGFFSGAIGDGHIYLISWTIAALVFVGGVRAWVRYERGRHGFPRFSWRVRSLARRWAVVFLGGWKWLVLMVASLCWFCWVAFQKIWRAKKPPPNLTTGRGGEGRKDAGSVERTPPKGVPVAVDGGAGD